MINSWEAAYFDFDEEKILEIARASVDMGVDLFVLDDGWFGKRDDDNAGLGDWTVNRKKLKDGISKVYRKRFMKWDSSSASGSSRRWFPRTAIFTGPIRTGAFGRRDGP